MVASSVDPPVAWEGLDLEVWVDWAVVAAFATLSAEAEVDRPRCRRNISLTRAL